MAYDPNDYAGWREENSVLTNHSCPHCGAHPALRAKNNGSGGRCYWVTCHGQTVGKTINKYMVNRVMKGMTLQERTIMNLVRGLPPKTVPKPKLSEIPKVKAESVISVSAWVLDELQNHNSPFYQFTDSKLASPWQVPVIDSIKKAKEHEKRVCAIKG